MTMMMVKEGEKSLTHVFLTKREGEKDIKGEMAALPLSYSCMPLAYSTRVKKCLEKKPHLERSDAV